MSIIHYLFDGPNSEQPNNFIFGQPDEEYFVKLKTDHQIELVIDLKIFWTELD